jgi:hypothetical protein
MTNGYDYSLQSANPRIVLSPNNHIDGQNYYNPRQSRGHKHQHSRGSSISSLQVPMGQTSMMRPDTPPESFDPQLYASLQQQYLELLATNQYLVQQHQQQQQQIQLQQQFNLAHQIHPLAFLSPPRTPVTACLPQYTHDLPSTYLSPGPERYQFQSPRRSRFDTNESEFSVPPTEPPHRSPSPSPSPASSESSWRRGGHRRGKSSITINGGAPKQPQPIRQPYGPPPMETLLANKASGAQSANFSSRLRRKAVNRLMQAGLERKQGSPGPNVPHFTFQDDQGKESPEPSEETTSDEEFDPRRRSAMF